MPATALYGVFGRYGNLQSRTGAAKPNLSDLPDWLSSQFQDTQTTDEGGSTKDFWNLNGNPWGGYKGQDGKNYVQVGDPSKWGGGAGDSADFSVIDPSKVTYDPDLGYVTTADNMYDSGHSFNRNDYERLGRNGALVVAAGYLAANGLAALGGAGDAGVGATATTALGGDAAAGTEIANAYAAGASPASFYEPLSVLDPANVAGSEIVNTYTAGADPSQFYQPLSPADAFTPNEVGSEIVNSYAPGSTPANYYDTLQPGETGFPDEAGNEIANQYGPDADPSKFYQPLSSGPSWLDRALAASRYLPALAKAVTPGGGTTPGGGRTAASLPSGGGAGSLGHGGGAGLGAKQPSVNTKLTNVGDLAYYLRGSHNG